MTKFSRLRESSEQVKVSEKRSCSLQTWTKRSMSKCASRRTATTVKLNSNSWQRGMFVSSARIAFAISTARMNLWEAKTKWLKESCAWIVSSILINSCNWKSKQRRSVIFLQRNKWLEMIVSPWAEHVRQGAPFKSTMAPKERCVRKIASIQTIAWSMMNSNLTLMSWMVKIRWICRKSKTRWGTRDRLQLLSWLPWSPKQWPINTRTSPYLKTTKMSILRIDLCRVNSPPSTKRCWQTRCISWDKVKVNRN